MEETKDVTVGKYKFHLTRIGAMTGSWILNLLLSAMFKSSTAQTSEIQTEESAEFKALSPEEKANISIATMWMSVGGNISEQVYEKIQKACIQCSLLYVSDNAPAIPVLSANGRWGDKLLEKDITTVNQLIVEVLQFNFAPFFTESALKSADSAAPDTNLSSSQPVTGSFSAQ